MKRRFQINLEYKLDLMVTVDGQLLTSFPNQ